MNKKKPIIKTQAEIEKIRQSAQLVSRTLGELALHIAPGITPLQLDKIAYDFIVKNGAKPGFLGLYGFPNSLCISVNEVIVHGIPNDKPLQEGDIISVDCGVLLDEYFGDQAYTFEVGNIDPKHKSLLETTKESLYVGAAQAKIGNRVGDIGFHIQQFCQKKGFSVVRELTGHGLGKSLHEGPDFPNYGKKKSGILLEEGFVFALEPMINLGTKEIQLLKDNWTIITADRKISAHFEHDIAIVKGEPVLLSTFDFIYESLEKKGIAYTDYRKKYGFS